jgi:hypothetical protein
VLTKRRNFFMLGKFFEVGAKIVVLGVRCWVLGKERASYWLLVISK